MLKLWILFFTVAGMTQLSTSQSYKPANVPTPVVAASVNSPANFSCDSFKLPLIGCLWEKPNPREPAKPTLIHISTDYKNGQATSVPGYTYLGQGLENGQCGIRINDVKEDDNAQWSCTLITGSGVLRGVVNVEILKKPNQPQFSEDFGRVTEGDEKSVTCFSANGQPAPTFQWFIDETPIEPSLISPIKSQTDSDTGIVTTYQKLDRFKFTWEHNGKKLRCLTVSEALTTEDIEKKRNEATLDIVVDYRPKAKQQSVNVQVPQLDSQAIIGINISANPDPKIYWTIGSRRVNARSKTPDQKFEARAPKQVDKDVYLCELIINSVSEEDLKNVYKLTAENQFGQGQFELRLSSGAEPGGSLSAGAIVGLVLGIPVILILIALVVVYARAKGLLCFKGDDGTSSEKERMGEDADSNKGGSESKPSISSRFSALAGNLWGKKKDKTAPADEEAVKQEKEKDVLASPEEKKPDDIVYAELDLARGGTEGGTQPVVVVRCSDEKTEYAEIVGVAQPSQVAVEKNKKSPSGSNNPSPKM